MADTASISVSAEKPAEGDIDREALGDALAPHLAAIVQVFCDHGFARSDIDIVNSLNDQTVHQGTGDDFDEVA